MSSDHLDKILKEVILGMEPEIPDTPEEAKIRKELEAEVAAMIARGEEPYLPSD